MIIRRICQQKLRSLTQPFASDIRRHTLIQVPNKLISRFKRAAANSHCRNKIFYREHENRPQKRLGNFFCLSADQKHIFLATDKSMACYFFNICRKMRSELNCANSNINVLNCAMSIGQQK